VSSAAPVSLAESLRPRWARDWAALGAASDGQALGERLLAAWSEPHRHYHTLQHLAECLALLDQHRGLAERPAEVAMALWFHDAIYAPRARDNEAQSAAWAVRELRAAGVAADAIARIEALILVTAHTGVPVGADAELLVDIDLAILGAEAPRYAEYDRQVRAEYRWVPGFLYRRGRRQVLADFAARRPLYRTPALRDALEARAAINLAGALARLG
jgi:predicted metal-dependent HD superfamily phosphohydrolase